MQRIIEPLMNDLYAGMLNKLALLWPEAGGWFPPEANINYEIAKLGSKYGYEVFGECNIGNKCRADMILLNPIEEWICHIECKLVNEGTCRSGAVVSDIERVNQSNGIDYLLGNVNYHRQFSALEKYKKYGLFVGADVSWLYSWWAAASGNPQSITQFCNHYRPAKEQKNQIDRLKFFQQQSVRWGTVPERPQDGKYWMTYAFFDLQQ